ncbi:NarK family nitrate/nitrite MFS transporter [Salipaludibacillus sp. LMS25]|uniref:NarK family nitrate/nitrite MFS transporter n=1 Tax=Salipaludibacillus sp. LMS25 TaxID=2924031 RepID=UPI0020D11B46|nr:NarK family nitrate/nitrite MFS transporter [Salipaludibacillus sp. LMS25]UTR13279.1 NarK family nitrate/nitrite MFS transporter [Salipaludibacillus sp. LMS25]
MKMLHLTWIAFFVSFFTWFNMAPLATTMMESSNWLTPEHLGALAIINVALTIPARIVIGMLLDRFGPRLVYSGLLILMSIPTFLFAFGDSWTQLMISRLLLSSIGASFVVGIRMVSEWFPPKDVGFAEGIYGGWGNFGSAVGAMILPWFALTMFGGDEGWRYAIALTGVICFIYGIIYYLFARDTPEGKAFIKPKKSGAMEVSSWKDLVLLIIWTLPLGGALAVLAWRLAGMGFISTTVLHATYTVIGLTMIYQIYKILHVNIPILRRGVPEDDKYEFKNVAALNSTYFANFGAELAIVSMLPMFFQLTFSLSPAAAGIIASSFAFINLVARPLGGVLSDRMGNRKNTMLIYMVGITIGLISMGFIDSTWPLALAIAVTIFTSIFVQGAEGATFAIIPMVKKRLTGQVAGMAGAYGNVGSTLYLTLYTFVSPQTFFFVLAGGALVSFFMCYLWLEEPDNAFAEDYYESSVDMANAIHTEPEIPLKRVAADK